MSGPTDQEIETIANSYRGWRAWDAEHAPSAAAKKQLRALHAAGKKMEATLGRLDPHARRHFAMRLGAACLTDGSLAVLTLAKSLESALLASGEATENIATSSVKSAERMLGDSLRNLFEHHGIPFNATNDSLGNQSLAVRLMVKIARLAGDRSLNPETARKWVQKAKRGNVSNPEPTAAMRERWKRSAKTRGLWIGDAAEETSKGNGQAKT